MKIKTLKLGLMRRDKATGLRGTLVHRVIDMGKNVRYIFQPSGMNPNDGTPVVSLFIELERLEDIRTCDFEYVDIPFEILGTRVTDMASGFTGIAVSFVGHINGCFHVSIQPRGVLRATNSAVPFLDFDLRRCTGPMIRKLNQRQLKKSIAETPSPIRTRVIGRNYAPAASRVCHR